jgi:hypothetical protein
MPSNALDRHLGMGLWVMHQLDIEVALRRTGDGFTTGISIVAFISTDPARSPSSTTSYGARRTSAPIALCVNFSVAGIGPVNWSGQSGG